MHHLVLLLVALVMASCLLAVATAGPGMGTVDEEPPESCDGIRPRMNSMAPLVDYGLDYLGRTPAEADAALRSYCGGCRVEKCQLCDPG